MTPLQYLYSILLYNYVKNNIAFKKIICNNKKIICKNNLLIFLGGPIIIKATSRRKLAALSNVMSLRSGPGNLEGLPGIYGRRLLIASFTDVF